MSRVSIIVPIYNAEEYLYECVDSLVGQTWRDIEIILINDGSTDSSAEICKSYLNDPRVIYRYQENTGVSAARNLGLSLATGDYIGFVDADDWLELDAMERLQGETADIVMYNFYHGARKHEEPLTDGVYPTEALFPEMISYVDETGEINYQFHTIWMRLFKRSLIEKYQIRFDTRFHNGEDLLFTLAATMKASTISVRLSEYLYHYRPTPGSQTTSYIKNYWELRKKIIEEIYALMEPKILCSQMPLRIFSWAVTGIENELHYTKGSKEQIKRIADDSICDVFKGKLDVSKFNEKNQRFYWYFCDSDADGIWLEYQRRMRARKRKKMIRHIKQKIKSILYIGN